jgi:hypothetical protein
MFAVKLLTPVVARASLILCECTTSFTAILRRMITALGVGFVDVCDMN